MTQIKYSVLIPTRERCDTLAWTLRTCVNQDYGNCEFIVSDNVSNDLTRDVVESFQDSRIKYVNPGRRVSMSANLEYALSHSQGEYITYIGDDDGLIPNAIKDFDLLLSDLGSPDAVAWRKAEYVWPRFPVAELQGYMMVPLSDRVERRSAKQMLDRVLAWEVSYLQLPCLYNSFVKRSAIHRATDLSGVFIHSCIPDVYSAIAVASVIDEYFFSLYPYSMNGASHHSIGGAHFTHGNDAPNASRFLAENDIPFHEALAMAPCAPIMAAESFLQVGDHIPNRKHVLHVDIRSTMREAARVGANTMPSVYQTISEAIRIIGRKHDLGDYAEELLAHYPNIQGASSEIMAGYRLPVQALFLFANDLGVTNIYDAALACKTIMTLHRNNPLGMSNLIKANLKLAPVYWGRAKDRLQRRFRRLGRAQN